MSKGEVIFIVGIIGGILISVAMIISYQVYADEKNLYERQKLFERQKLLPRLSPQGCKWSSFA